MCDKTALVLEKLRFFKKSFNYFIFIKSTEYVAVFQTDLFRVYLVYVVSFVFYIKSFPLRKKAWT